LIDGTRPWDMDKHSLEQVVNQNLRSEISNLAKKEKRYVIIKDFFDEDNEDDNYNTEMDKLVHTQAEDIEGKMDAEAILTFCNDKILKDDEDGKIVLDEMLQGKKQKDIASYLGITVEEAEVHIRRIRRKIRAELPSSLLKNIPENLINKMPNNKRSNAYDKKQIKHIIKPIPG